MTGSAGRTFLLVNVEAVEGNGIEQPVDGSQRTEVPAEGPVNRDGKEDECGQYRHLPGKEPAQGLLEGRIGGNQRNPGEEGAGWTDVFTEPGLALAHDIQNSKGKHDDEACQDSIFEIF